MTRRKDVELLRELAYRIKEIASDPVQEERRRRWYAHNRLERGKPLVFCSPEGSWDELVPEGGLRAEDPLLRRWERELRMRIYSFEHFNDDQITDDTFKVGYVCTNTGWGAQLLHKLCKAIPRQVPQELHIDVGMPRENPLRHPLRCGEDYSCVAHPVPLVQIPDPLVQGLGIPINIVEPNSPINIIDHNNNVPPPKGDPLSETSNNTHQHTR